MNLVTGATGLVGSHVMLALLKRNKPVVAMMRPGSDIGRAEKLFSYYTPDYKALFSKIKWVEADLADVMSLEQALEGVETVYHCAGFISFDDKDRSRLLKTNAGGTANLVNTCLAKNIKAFCHVSSVATLQNADVKKEVDESVLWKPASRESAYALSKYLAEQEVWRAAEEGLQTVIVNPGVIIGPGPWDQGSGRLFGLCHKGTKYYTGGVTGFVGAEDVAEIMIGLTEQKKFAERYILIENNYSFREVLHMIHRAFGKPVPEREAGKLLLGLAGFLGRVLPLKNKITRDTIEASLNKTYFSNQKVKEAMQYRFRSLSECISFTCRAYSSEKPL